MNKNFQFANSKMTLTTNKEDVTDDPKGQIYYALMPSISLVRNVIKGNIFINKYKG